MIDPIAEAWRAQNGTEPPPRIIREDLRGKRDGEKRKACGPRPVCIPASPVYIPPRGA